MVFTTIRLFSQSLNVNKAWILSNRPKNLEDTKMHMSGESLLVVFVVGLIAGWLAGQIVQGTGFGIVGDLLIGIAGAFIGSWLLPQLGFHLGSGIVLAVINATIGAFLDSRAKCYRALREPDLHVFAKLFEDCLKRSFEAQAFSGREIGGDDDVLDFLVGHFVDVDLTRQPAS